MYAGWLEGSGADVDVDVVDNMEGGSVEGSCLYVYGRGVGVGNDRKGDTVRGTWARRGWGSMGITVLARFIRRGFALCGESGWFSILDREFVFVLLRATACGMLKSYLAAMSSQDAHRKCS
jgi:hypothetical protein